MLYYITSFAFVFCDENGDGSLVNALGGRSYLFGYQELG